MEFLNEIPISIGFIILIFSFIFILKLLLKDMKELDKKRQRIIVFMDAFLFLISILFIFFKSIVFVLKAVI